MLNDAPAACAALFEELADIVFGHPIDACVDDFLHRVAVVKRKQRVHRLLAHLEGTLSHERGDIPSICGRARPRARVERGLR